MTVSHLRFGPRPIRSTYLISSANFVACHQPSLLARYDVLKELAPGGTFLFNGTESQLPDAVRQQLVEKSARVFECANGFAIHAPLLAPPLCELVEVHWEEALSALSIQPVSEADCSSLIADSFPRCA